MLIGRKNEIKKLNDCYSSDESSFVAIYGRRGVGKTYLIKNVFENRFTFRHVGIYKGTTQEQLHSFSSSLKEYGLTNFETPQNWFEAFDLLKELIKYKNNTDKKVIFLDEISWIYTQGSDFIKAFEHFYNSWCTGRNDILLIICSSITSWIMKKIIHNKGGLYNRLTEQIYLRPFSLNECEEFSIANKLSLTKKQIIEIYMIIGGIPYYWTFYKKGNSVPQFIDNTFFVDKAPLENEFKYLFSSLFNSPKDYLKIVDSLSTKNIGLTRKQILSSTKIKDTGLFSSKLEELIDCDFVRRYSTYGQKKREIIYQLTDPFLIFYYHFLKNKQNIDYFWEEQINNPAINSWKGIAFERICFAHSYNIKKALGISGVLTSIYPWSVSKDLDKGIFGSQVDMVIERKDEIINLVEIKFCSGPYVITSKYFNELEKKKNDFITATKTNSSIHLTFITLNGVQENTYSKEIQSFISAIDLF